MTLHALLLTALLLFGLGLFAVIARRHLIGMLIGVELMLNAANLNIMAFNHFVVADRATGQILALVTIGLAAAEAAIALSIILAVYRSRHSADVERLDQLEG